jgi:hypothetical protein
LVSLIARSATVAAGLAAESATDLLAARRTAAGIQRQMLVGEQKQDRVALLLLPAGWRSLISPFGGTESAGCA